jgi:hypothetical protein
MTSNPRRLPLRPLSALLVVAALVAAALAFAAAPAHAGLSTWTQLQGLAPNNDPAHPETDPETIRAFATGSPPTTIYAGTDGAGVWRSVNDGLTWSHYSSGLSFGDGSGSSYSVYSLSFAGGNVLASTGGGLFSAPDSFAGGSFSPLAQGAETDPSNPTKLNDAVETVASVSGKLLAGTFSEGVYTSTDDGQTWKPPAAGNGMAAATTVWNFASIGPVVWAASSTGIYRSLDGGATWTLSDDGIPGSATTFNVFEDTGNPLIIYALTASDGVYRSIDGGTTWQSINGDPAGEPLGSEHIYAAQEFSGSSQTRLYVATQDGVWVGTLSNVIIPGTGGKSAQIPVTPIWRQVTEQGLLPHDIVWSLSSFTTVPGTVLAGTQGGGGFSLTFQPPHNSGQPADLPTWLLAGVVPLDVGTTLIGESGVWTGTPQIDYAYQWQRCTSSSSASCSDISGATDRDYTLSTGDQGRYIRVVVTASNDFPSFPKVPYTAASTVSGPVAAEPGPLPGDTQHEPAEIEDPAGDIALPNEGDTLTAPKADPSDPTGGGWYFNPAANVVLFQWLRCDSEGNNCAPILGATNSSYVVTAADDGDELEVQTRGENGNGISQPFTSGATNPIIPLPAKATSPPTIAGSATVGSSLVGAVGTWASPNTYWSRQWLQCEPDGSACSPIQGATSASYVVQPDDYGMTIRLEVTADVNPSFQLPDAVTVDSAQTTVVAYPPGQTPPPGPTPGPSGPQGPPAGGGPKPAKPAPPKPSAPILSALKLAGNGRAVTFQLSGPGTVTLQLQRASIGHRHGNRCLAGAPKKKANRCARYTTLLTAVHPDLAAGARSVPLPTKLHGHNLPRGTYRVVLTSQAAGGGPVRTVTLTLVFG